jgi:multiple sugar transport system ATP-binding protein
MMASFEHHEGVFDPADIVARVDPRDLPRKGQQVTVAIRPDQLHLFSPVSGERLN